VLAIVNALRAAERELIALADKADELRLRKRKLRGAVGARARRSDHYASGP
jgi:hypothetical protein